MSVDITNSKDLIGCAGRQDMLTINVSKADTIGDDTSTCTVVESPAGTDIVTHSKKGITIRKKIAAVVTVFFTIPTTFAHNHSKRKLNQVLGCGHYYQHPHESILEYPFHHNDLRSLIDQAHYIDHHYLHPNLVLMRSDREMKSSCCYSHLLPK